MNSSIVIIHYQPLEAYPPIMNLINHLGNRNKSKKIFILTTNNTYTGINDFNSVSKSVIIFRIGGFKANANKIFKSMQYLIFYVFSFFFLILKKPSRIVYYETLSSYPVYLYFKYFNKNVEIFIHYHEYMTSNEYLTGMKLVKYFHSLEKYLYENAVWISHTNSDRLDHFMKDESIIYSDRLQILSNFPPKNWLRVPEKNCDTQIKIVYVGALSLETMFVKEFVDWILLQEGKVSFDIFSTNITPETYFYITSLNSPFVNLNPGVDYFSLPEILVNYHVGVILYKGHIPNYIYNAPNKLFEYLALGLDVWFPDLMLGCDKYITHETYPKVLSVHFENMTNFNLNDAFNKNGLVYYPSNNFCESEFESITNLLLEINA